MKYNRDFCQTRILSKRDEGWKVKNFTAKNNSRTVQCFLKVLFRKKKSKYFHSRWKKESFRDSLINSQQSNQTDFNILVFFSSKQEANSPLALGESSFNFFTEREHLPIDYHIFWSRETILERENLTPSKHYVFIVNFNFVMEIIDAIIILI